MPRGAMTEEIKEVSKRMLGYEINQVELRLLAYVQYCVQNEKFINRERTNRTENQILVKWQGMGFCDNMFVRDEMTVTKEFWDAMCEILWLGYVSYE